MASVNHHYSSGQRSLVSTTLGLIMYLRSPSEFGRYSIGEETRWVWLAAHMIIILSCNVDSLDIQFSIAAKRKPWTLKQNAVTMVSVTIGTGNHFVRVYSSHLKLQLNKMMQQLNKMMQQVNKMIRVNMMQKVSKKIQINKMQ